MIKTKQVITVIFFLCITISVQARNPFWCWLIDLEGCPGVRPKSGNARTLGNSGTAFQRHTSGANRERVDNRTMINVMPEYKLRRLKSSLDLVAVVLSTHLIAMASLLVKI